MFDYFVFFVFMTLIGSIGSGIGGMLGGIVRVNKKWKISAIMDITSGIMTGIVCLDMIPESINAYNKLVCLLGILLGTILILIIDMFVVKFNKENNKITSLIIMLSMAIHNMIEGLAIGCSFSYSYDLGIAVMISIILHDIPEGMVVGITNKLDDFKLKDIIINSALIGSFMGLGAGIGKIIGGISEKCLSLGLSSAAGAMLYVVACNLIPDSKKLSNNRLISIFYIIGIILSLLIFFN